MLKKFILVSLSVLLLTGCGSGSDGGFDDSKSKLKVLSDDFDEVGLKQLNLYRSSAGMREFSINTILTKVAQDHASYQIENNLYTHYQQDKTPLQRVIEEGYSHGDISENIYAGNVSTKRSIDILFSNIYHRLAFLDFGFDEIGFGLGVSKDYAFKRVYTYEMGRANSRLSNEKQNPKVVLWPYKNQKDVMPVFYEELPDPLPECSVSGYPISIQFNPTKTGKIVLESLSLYDESGEITDTKLLEKNQYLSDKEFVLMPLTRLKWGKTYHVKAHYHEDEGATKSLTWEFTTTSLPKPNFIVEQTNQNFTLESGKTYYLYLPPQDCNDMFKSYRYEHTYDLKVEDSMIDNNTIKIKATGVGMIEIETDNKKKIILRVNRSGS
jgi:hypothetical protein